MTIRTHDFSLPPSLHPETRAKLVLWMSRVNSQLSQGLAENSLTAEFHLDDCATAWPMNELATWPEKSIAFRAQLSDVSACSVIAVSNPLMQLLVGTLLGETFEEWPNERDLTPSELSVAELFMSRISAALSDSWSGDAPINLQISEQEANLRRSKAFKFSEPCIVCRSTISLPFGSGQICWMLPHDYLTKLFGSIRQSAAEIEFSPREQLETLARDMSTQLTIRLGTVQLTAPQLAELRIGDLVVLNQKTSEPLRATVSGQTRFFGWPGRVGNRQALEIATEGPRRERTIQAPATSQLVAAH